VVLRCVIGLCLGTLVHAQTTGGVRGTVKDATGAVVPHATVAWQWRSLLPF
jgi:glycogen synthase